MAGATRTLVARRSLFPDGRISCRHVVSPALRSLRSAHLALAWLVAASIAAAPARAQEGDGERRDAELDRVEHGELLGMGYGGARVVPLGAIP